MGLRSHEQWQELQMLFCRPSHITKCFNCRTVTLPGSAHLRINCTFFRLCKSLSHSKSNTLFHLWRPHRQHYKLFNTKPKSKVEQYELSLCALHTSFLWDTLGQFFAKNNYFLISLSALFLWEIFFFFITGCTSAFISKPFFGFSPKVSSHAFPTKTFKVSDRSANQEAFFKYFFYR